MSFELNRLKGDFQLKIGIFSDSHKKTKYLKKVLKLFKKEKIQYLISAGDLEIEDNLKLMKDFGKPYVAVFGNNDFNLFSAQNDYNIYKEPFYFQIKKTSFKLMHLPFYMSGDTDIIIFGHTHKFEVNFINNTLFLNPGEVCARKKDLIECAILDIIENKYIINYYSTNKDKISWKNLEYSFKKSD